MALTGLHLVGEAGDRAGNAVRHRSGRSAKRKPGVAALVGIVRRSWDDDLEPRQPFGPPQRRRIPEEVGGGVCE